MHFALRFDVELEETVVNDVDWSSAYERSMASSFRQSSRSVLLLVQTSATGAFNFEFATALSWGESVVACVAFVERAGGGDLAIVVPELKRTNKEKKYNFREHGK